MDKVEAHSLLNQHLTCFRQLSYAELVKLIGKPQVYETVGPSSTRYTVEVEVFWDSKRDGALRVMGAIDDGGWRAFVPLSEDFLVTPDDQASGE